MKPLGVCGQSEWLNSVAARGGPRVARASPSNWVRSVLVRLITGRSI